MRFYISFLALALTVKFSIAQSTMTDPRDGEVYDIEVVGDKIWMTENLRYNSEGSYCYENLEQNCDQQGRLYTWAAALEACPKGWHLATDSEWRALTKKFGGWDEDAKDGGAAAYKALIKDGKGEFNAILAGRQDATKGKFHHQNRVGHYWTATEGDKYYTFAVDFNADYGKIIHSHYLKKGSLSCRCVQD
ncbi:MAG: hypothetical protein MK212_14275 [Saprospiraceae bacterium]|nr:hypothetical protein [Saprospiraceae bacterium]